METSFDYTTDFSLFTEDLPEPHDPPEGNADKGEHDPPEKPKKPKPKKPKPKTK